MCRMAQNDGLTRNKSQIEVAVMIPESSDCA